MPPVLEVKDLRKTYVQKPLFSTAKNIEALKGISFAVQEGEIFGILGPNGAGKSTLLNILSDVLTHDAGEVMIFGKDYFKNTTEIKHHMALINGYASAPYRLTIHQNLRINAKIFGVKDYEKRIDELLELVNLKDIKHKRYSQVSSGQRTRVNIVRGLLHRPKLILMDEPTIGLDPQIAKVIRELIKKINKKEKVTILFTSHNMAEVEEVCDRIALLKEGDILRIATLPELVKLIDVLEYHVEFKGDNKKIKKILNTLKTLDYTITKNKLKIKATQAFKLDDMIDKFVKSKLKITKLNVVHPNLEKIFIEIAEGRL